MTVLSDWDKDELLRKENRAIAYEGLSPEGIAVINKERERRRGVFLRCAMKEYNNYLHMWT